MRNGMVYIAVLELEGSLGANRIDACGDAMNQRR